MRPGAIGLGTVATLLLGPTQCVGGTLLEAVGIVADIEPGDACAHREIQTV
ncbi:hypothetical protein ACFQGA_16600 [Marinobacter koreensis]|uniref:hypothetical protein n=1 Tax=Marinobacter koreensis TaxID=335974 RepID=UPI00361FF47F